MRERRRPVLIALGCAGALLVLWLVVDRVGPLPGERRLVDALRRHPASGSVQHLLAFFGDLGYPIVAVPTVLCAAGVVLRRIGPRAALFVGLGAGAAVLDAGLKSLLGPTRYGTEVFGGTASFPSGHVAYATGLFGALVLLGRRHRRPEVVLIGLGLALAMGPARVWSLAHLPSDVLGGYLLGAAWLAALLALLGPGALRA